MEEAVFGDYRKIALDRMGSILFLDIKKHVGWKLRVRG
jgi:hypothetical protein